MPRPEGPRVVVRTGDWGRSAPGVHALVKSHAFNASVHLLLPAAANRCGPGEDGGDCGDTASPRPRPPPAPLRPPPPFYAFRASPAALATPEFATWAFPEDVGDGGGVVGGGGGGGGGGSGGDASTGPASTHAAQTSSSHPPSRRPTVGATALACPGDLEGRGAACVTPGGRLLLTLPGDAWRGLGLPGARVSGGDGGWMGFGRVGAVGGAAGGPARPTGGAAAPPRPIPPPPVAR